MAHPFPLAMGSGRRHDRSRRADDVLQSRSSGAIHAGRSLVLRVDLVRGGEAAWLHRHLRYVGRTAAGVRGVDGGQRQGRRAGHDHHATLLPRTPRSLDRLENLYRAAGEVGERYSRVGLMVRDARRCRAPHHEGLEDLILRSALTRVSKDEATVPNHVPSSLNLPATSSLMASIAACASGPIAETTIDVPGPADSIISPMIDVPPTVSPPLVTHTSALKRSTICTNFADARAWRPRLLIIGSSRETAPAGTVGPGTLSGDASSLICRREPGLRW